MSKHLPIILKLSIPLFLVAMSLNPEAKLRGSKFPLAKFFLTFFIFSAGFLIASPAYGATRFDDTTADHKWSTAGNWSAGVPDSADDVTVGTAVTSIIIDATAACLSFDLTGVIDIAVSGASNLTISGSVTIPSSGVAWTHAGALFVNGTGNVYIGISLSTISALYFNGSGKTVTLTNDLNISTKTLYFYGPTLITNNYTVTAGNLSDGGSGWAKTLTLGTSVLNLGLIYLPSGGLVVTDTNHTINISSDSAAANSFAGKAWGIVNFKSNASAARAHAITPGSGATFVQFNIDQLTDRRDVSVSFDGDFSISQSSTWKSGGAGNDDPTYRLLIKSNTTGTQRTATVTATSQTLTFTDVDFQDIKVTTTNSPTITKTRTGDAGGNTGGATITSTPKTVYADAGTATVFWYDDIWSTDVTRVAATSLNNFPLPQDTAVFDNDTWDDTSNNIYPHSYQRSGNIDASGLTENQIFHLGTNSPNTIVFFYGSLDLSGSGVNVSLNYTNPYYIDARVKDEASAILDINIPTSSGTRNFTIDSYGGTVKLLSAFAPPALTLTRGIFDLNGNTLTTKTFSSTGTVVREIKDSYGGGNIIIIGTTGTVLDMTDPTSLTVSNAPAVTLNGALTSDVTFAGGGKTFGNFWNHTTNAYNVLFTGSNIFNDFKVDAGRTVQFTAGTNTTVNSFTAVGTSGSPITIGSITNATHTLAKSGVGTVTCDYCNISYSTATPANTWYATNSTNNGNNSGWTFGQIYRSAAPDDNGDNNIAALATGGSNAMTISGSMATFTTALADNIGVGDVLQYDSNNNGSIGAGDAPAFISGRTSSTVYTVKTAAGGIPTARSADTTWSIFRAYTSLFNAEAGTENTAIDSNLRNFDTWSGGKDIATPGEQWNIALYANGTTADTTAVTISGWTTSASNYFRIYTPYLSSEVGVSQRHSGKWDVGKHNLLIANDTVLVVSDEYVRLDGIQIGKSSSNDDGQSGIMMSNLSTNNEIQISNSIIKQAGNASYNESGISANDADAIIKVWNVLIYGLGEKAASGNAGIGASSLSEINIYSSTIIGGYRGIFASSGGTWTAKNVYASGAGSAFGGTGTITMTNCASSDATGSTGLQSIAFDVANFTNVNVGSEDLHLPFGSALKGVGKNTSADAAPLNFQNDIDMQERKGNWSIGADEPSGGTVQSSTLSSQSLTSGLVGHWTFDGADTPWTSATAGTTKDSSGNNNTGTLTNMSQASSPVLGKLGQALNFDGSNSKIDVSHSNSNDNLSAMTISAWIYAKSYGEGNQAYIVSKEYNGSYGWKLQLMGPYTNLYFLVDYDGTSLRAYSAGSSFTSADFNKWIQITMTWDGTVNTSGVSFYKNGVLLSHYTALETDGVGNRLSDTTLPLEIGNAYFQSRTFDGSLDDVRVYNRAISVDEVGDLYRLGQDKIGMPLTDKMTTGLVGMWSFDGADISGTNAYDRSPVGTNTGTITGAVPAIGKRGQGLRFDGVDDRINAGNGASIRFDKTTNFSWSFWIKPDSVSSGNYQALFNEYSSTNYKWVGLTPTGGGVRFDYGGSADNSVGGIVVANIWQNLVLTHIADTNNYLVYVDGTLKDTLVSTGSGANTANKLIGISTSNSYPFKGLIDEVRVYNRTLNVDEVGDLYRLGSVSIKR